MRALVGDVGSHWCGVNPLRCLTPPGPQLWLKLQGVVVNDSARRHQLSDTYPNRRRVECSGLVES
jgi:hypothetical protein